MNDTNGFSFLGLKRAIVASGLMAFLLGGAATAQNDVVFNRDVRPILTNKCLACHGRDVAKREADLRLDTFEGATGMAGGTVAIVPGNLDESEFWARITSDDLNERMPPPDSHKELSPAEIETLRKWIASGAQYQKHWSFEPVASVAPPAELFTRGGNPIDAFVLARLNKKNWRLKPEADRSILIRRVSFVLTGLPPTPLEVDRFLSDNSPNAFEQMVDRYLTSPHYGEEMARHWLDIARYADTHGLHLDNERQIWAYRDWVVKSFNRNQRFDEFTIEQLAGDLLEKPTTDQLIATGFNRCNVTTSEGGSINEEFIFRYAVDRASTTAQTWLGLSAGCAVCHDHKFDPISAKEFYSLYAFFNSAADPAMDGNTLLTNPVLKIESDTDTKRLAEFDAKIAALQKQIDDRIAGIVYVDPATIDPVPPPQPVEQIWLEDDFPTNGRVVSVGHGTKFVSVDDKELVFSGKRSLKRTDSALSQDVWENGTTPLTIPAESKIFASVFLDPQNLPQSIMLQFFKNGWLHRAVWGNYDVIPWGTANTTERVLMGELPKAGEWVLLEIPVAKIGLAPGDQLTGFATTQFGGTVYWDKVGVLGNHSPASDPLQSFSSWWKAAKDKGVAGLPGDLNELAKKGPDGGADEAAMQRLRRYYLSAVCLQTKATIEPLIVEINQTRNEQNAFDAAIPRTFIYNDLAQPRDSFVMLRGQYDKPGEKVEPDVPAILPPLAKRPGSAHRTRLDLAHWLVEPQNPLTARVAVNRLWQQIFGVGLVKSSAEFGIQGELPSHPELLDFLATHFRESGWNVKAMVKLMLTSETFRQDSRAETKELELDPENRLLARGSRLRLDAEQIRDNALFVSKLIDLSIGGKGVRPYQPPNIWEPVGFVGSNTRDYRPESGAALYRRSLYTFYKRTAPPPFMVNFDAPNREQSCPRRERSNTPLQALQLLNDIQHVEAARALAQRLLLEGGQSATERIDFLFRVVLARHPDAEEMKIVQAQLSEHLTRYDADKNSAAKLIAIGESKADDKISAAELAAYTLVASTILNMDETLSRN